MTGQGGLGDFLLNRDAEASTWVYLVGAVGARAVKIGTAADVAGRLRDLQCGSPVQLHIMWQTRGGRDLERALHKRFAAYRVHGEWFDFGDDHPVAIIATAAVAFGYRAYPSAETHNGDALPTQPQVAEGRQLATLFRDAFAEAGDPPLLPFSQILDYLSVADPEKWGKWESRPDRLMMAGRVIGPVFRAAQLDISTVRDASLPGRPTCYRLDEIDRAAP
ncbi:GIY-YIG nuclease family protein [Streptomyces acidicola]|uniref:GIY-YIG nuclease family protein n=1 Tax=Streptomyces acidicola TaxID=2596892 RepID=UPI00379D6C86